MISLSDPASSWTAAPAGPAFFAYSTNYLIDLETGIIMDVEATPANRSHEVESTKTMIDRVEQRLCLQPARLVGDTAYGTAAMLGWMVEQKEIATHVPVWERYARKDDAFSTNEFKWNEMTNEYRFPAGNALRSDVANSRTRVRTSPRPIRLSIYRSSQLDCAGCSMKERCCPKTPVRKVVRSIHEAARDEARLIATTPAYKQSRRERKKVEMLFAHLKRILKLVVGHLGVTRHNMTLRRARRRRDHSTGDRLCMQEAADESTGWLLLGARRSRLQDGNVFTKPIDIIVGAAITGWGETASCTTCWLDIKPGEKVDFLSRIARRQFHGCT
jgi:hypothetical protein